MCTENKTIVDFKRLFGYKIFAEVDNKLYSPFFSSFMSQHVNLEYEFNQHGLTKSKSSFHVFANKDDAMQLLKDLHRPGNNGWNVVHCDRFVCHRVVCKNVVYVGEFTSGFEPQLVMHAKSILLKERVI